jgi:hypothetical protein
LRALRTKELDLYPLRRLAVAAKVEIEGEGALGIEEWGGRKLTH